MCSVHKFWQLFHSNAPKRNRNLPKRKTAVAAAAEDSPYQRKRQVSLETADKSQTEPAKPIERKIIRNAELSLESDAPEEAQQKITAIAESKGGFVVESTAARKRCYFGQTRHGNNDNSRSGGEIQ